jgi:hypothetical protein
MKVLQPINALSFSTTIDKWNEPEYYNGLLYSIEELDELQLTSDCTKLEKLSELIPLWSNEDLFGKNHKVESRNCTRLVYMYLNLTLEITPYIIAGVTFYHPPFYIGEGTLERCISHTVSTKADLTKSTTMLKEIMIDFKSDGLPIGIVFPCVGMNVDGVKEVEADLIKIFNDLQHYTRGIESFKMCPGILNIRRETQHAGHIFGPANELKNK